MIRITYQDREYTLQPDDNGARPLRLGTKESGAWVTVLDTAGFRIQVLAGGAKLEPTLEAATAAQVETRGKA